MIGQHWHLIQQLARHEVVTRYQGSILGMLWMLLNPLVMLAIYGFVFNVIFQARWPGLVDTDQPAFVLILFAGLIIFNFASETWARAPGLLRENASYVKKVIFPLYVLPIAALVLPLLQAIVSSCLLLIGYIFVMGALPIGVLLLPVIALIYVAMVLGVSYIFTTIGTFVPDLRHVIGTLMTILLFLSPVFYPISVLPKPLQIVVNLSPLTFFLESTRSLLFGGTTPSLVFWILAMAGSALCLAVGLLFFKKARGAFSDVL